MEIYRGAAERLVEIYDFDWKENERMKKACICNLFVHICIYFCIMPCLYIFKHCFFSENSFDTGFCVSCTKYCFVFGP